MIQLESISVHRGDKTLLNDANWLVHEQQRIGLIGINGCGKSTLLHMISHRLLPDAGDISIPKHLRIACMDQSVTDFTRNALDYVIDGDAALRAIEQKLSQARKAHNDEAVAHWLAEFEQQGGYQIKSRAEKLLHGLGFTQQQLKQSVGEFSGGWRMRLHLGRTLMTPSDLLLLDEPTNHLDLNAIIWLEKWLMRYEGTLIVISHDRDFLDAITTHITQIHDHQLFTYRGNYTRFENAWAEQLSQQAAAYKKQQQTRERIHNYVRRFGAKATKAKQAQSRLKALERMETLAPIHVASPFQFQFIEPPTCPERLLRLKEVTLGYDKTPILTNLDIAVTSGLRLGLLGKNGAGKSTLIKAIAGTINPILGERQAHDALRIGYFSQHHVESLDLQVTPLLYLQRLTPQASEQSLKNFLGGFGFQGERATGTVEFFSGGERARLALAGIAWQKPNLLLLDEPTNHLDLQMRESLIFALQAFQGALIVISHDRHLLRSTVDELMLVHDHTLSSWEKGLEDYSRWLDKQAKTPQTPLSPTKATNTIDRKQLRQQQAAKRQALSALKKEIDRIEADVHQTQSALAILEEKLADSTLYEAQNKETLKQYLAEQSQLKQVLEHQEALWLEKQEQWEQHHNE